MPALERPLAGPDDVGGEVLVAPLGEPLGDLRVDLGPLAGEDQQLLGVAALRASSRRRSTSSGAWMCAWCVAKAQYLQ